MEIVLIVYLAVLGLCFGSFINALNWRLHAQAEREGRGAKKAPKREPTSAELSMVKGRSMCSHCHHPLAPKDLVPLFSWLWLRGKCRYCKHRIEDSPLIELFLPVLFVVSYLCWPYDFTAQGIFLLICWLVALVGLLALLAYDLRWMLLPNKIVFPLIGLGVVQVLVRWLVFDEGIASIGQALISVAIAGGIFYVLFHLSDGSWIGGGDVKLGYALGLLIGSGTLAGLMLFIASVLGILASLPGMLQRKLSVKSRIPFGPCLIVATIIVVLFGQSLLDAYWQLLDGLYGV
jgi:prepilin signal peptidase PulO-like enzyme (type II secretory pathway)